MACLVVDDAKCVPGIGRGAHPARTVSGPSHPDYSKPKQNQLFFISTWHVLSSTMRNAFQEWGAAHIPRGRLRQPQAGGAILPVKNHTTSTCFFSACTFLSSALRNSWQEWDAVHIARDRAKCRSRFGAARMCSESCAPAEARRTFVARQFVERLGPPGASQGLLEHPGASPGPRGSSWGLLGLPGAS